MLNCDLLLIKEHELEFHTTKYLRVQLYILATDVKYYIDTVGMLEKLSLFSINTPFSSYELNKPGVNQLNSLFIVVSENLLLI